MNSTVKLGRIFGVPVGLHWSWFLIFLFVAWSLATGIFARQLPGQPPAALWGMGFVTSLMLFLSVLAHEFGHAVVSIRNRIPVERITLLIFGGVAQISREPQSPGVEFRIAIAGPLVSLGLGLLFGGVFLLARGLPVIASPSFWLAQINITLAAFNLIPGFPLDGGRVLRAALWAWNGSYQKSTRAAVFTGQGIALGFMLLGIFSLTRSGIANAAWLMFVGWFLFSAAGSSREDAEQHPGLMDVRVTQLMDRRFAEVPASMPLNRLVEEEIVRGGSESFVVSENQRLVGLVTIRDIINIPREAWSWTQVAQVMVPWERFVPISPDTALTSALQTMEISHLAHVPVMIGNHVEGLLSREHVLQYLRMRAEPGA